MKGEASPIQKRAIADLSERMFGQPGRAVVIASDYLTIERGFTSEHGRLIFASLMEASQEADSQEREAAFRRELKRRSPNRNAAKTASPASTSSTAPPPVRRRIGPVEGKGWVEWATADLGLGSAPVVTECSRCGGTGKVERMRRATKSAVIVSVLGQSRSTSVAEFVKTLANPPLSRLTHVARLLNVDLDLAARWIVELREAANRE